MKVFNTCFLIIFRNFGRIMTFLLVFLVMGFLLSVSYQDPVRTDFTASLPPFTIINEDETSTVLDGLTSFLREHGTEVVLENSPEALQDAAFFHETEYILKIPAGFSDALRQGAVPMLDTVTFPDSTSGYYLDLLVNSYLNQFRMYRSSLPGLSEEEITARILENLSANTQVDIQRFMDSAPVSITYTIYYRFLAYFLMILTITCISIILRRFKQPDLWMRSLCTPLRPLSMSIQLLSFGLILSIVFWGLMILSGLIVYRNLLKGVDSRLTALLILNSFCYTMVCFPIALCLGRIVRTENGQSIVSNLVSLVLSFLGGVFVSTDLLGESLTRISRLVPTWWYSSTLDHICSLNSIDAESLRPIYQGMAIQLGFAAALLCCFLVINKQKNKAVESFGADLTEREE